ncbi:hypothetical protein [Colwellia ponticola]|uniref:Uncharacterized protein n=1 Tax=Colwellia ponticola TaxID=2304625 RepID=A0A8H2JNT7_9GAMM|nr:hypothetical protein [Colwellia ponticola]TMM45702.1 hypothetical protein FCS21_07720 [Colwellia ponticola]
MTAQLSIILLNVTILFLAYTWLYPQVAGKNLQKVALLDCVVSAVALLIVASKYWGLAIAFDFLSYELNWFWFTLLSYSLIEIPIAIWYFRALWRKDDSES